MHLTPNANVIISAIHPDTRESADIDGPGVSYVIVEGIRAVQRSDYDGRDELRRGDT